MEKVYENIYKNEIPLPNNPLRIINSYIITSDDKNLIIDSGFDHEACKEAFFDAVSKLNLDLDNTYLLITHLHSDHSGLASKLSKEGIKLYAGEIDGKMINRMSKQEYWDNFNNYKTIFGLDKDNITFDDHPGYKYCPKEEIDFIPLNDGDTINIGEYSFDVVDIKGHTPGHIGLYEKNHKLFFSGDHILDRITPNIAFWGYEHGDILDIFLNNLNKINDYDIDIVFPAHRNIITDHQRRIKELKNHHNERLEEILKIVKENPKITVRDVASKMNWQFRAKSFLDFPNPQKWFACGEAMTHLLHLCYQNKINKVDIDNTLYFKINI